MAGLIGWKLIEIEECNDVLKFKVQTSFRLVLPYVLVTFYLLVTDVIPITVVSSNYIIYLCIYLASSIY